MHDSISKHNSLLKAIFNRMRCEFVKLQLIKYICVSNVFYAVKEAEEYYSSLHGLTMKRNTAYSVPHSVKEDIYDEVEPVSEYEKSRAHPRPQARVATVTVGDKPHVIVKDSSTRKGFIAVALITGALIFLLIFLLLITILSLVSVQSAAIMSEKQGKISACM